MNLEIINLIPIGFFLIIFGAISYVIEYTYFGTSYMILIGWFGLILSVTPLVVILIRRDGKNPGELV